MVKPREVLAQAGHHNDAIIAQHVSSGLENETVNDVEVVVLKFGGCQLRLEVEALLADGLQRIVPGLESDERRSIGSGVVKVHIPRERQGQGWAPGMENGCS